MSWIEKIAPQFALKRQIARQRLERVKSLQTDFKKRGNEFEAVSGDRLNHIYGGYLNFSPDSAIYDDLEKLRNNVRKRERESGFTSGVIKRIVKNTVGTGIYPQSRCMADKEYFGNPKINERAARLFNHQAEKHFRTWAKKSDVRLKQTFWDQQAEICAALIRDGETLVIGRQSAKPDRILPYCLETREIDYLVTPRAEVFNPKIKCGIEHDEEGAPKAYYFYKGHPGEQIHITDASIEEVPAYFPNGRKKVFHLFSPIRRPGQTRGFSDFAPGLKTVQNLDKYWEAEILAALEDACMTGIVKTPNPVGFQSGYTLDSDGDGNRIHEFAPNQIHYLNPGEDFDIHKPNRPNSQMEVFTHLLMSDPASALDVPVEVFNMNWKGLNYSNARTILLQFYASCTFLSVFMVRHFCDCVWENVISDFVVNGMVGAPGFDRRKDDYLQTKWIPRVYRRWIDPTKEANGKETDLKTLVETLSDIHSERGDDWEEKLTQRARELQKIKELEKEYDITFATEQPGQPVADEPDDAEPKPEPKRNVVPGPWA